MTASSKLVLSCFPGTFLLFALLAVVWWVDAAWGYAGLVCGLCNMGTLDWHRLLREKDGYTQGKLALCAGLAYPWLLAAIAVEARDRVLVLSNGWSAHLGDLYAVAAAGVFACFYLVMLMVLALTWEAFRADGFDRAVRNIGLTVLSFVFPCWMLAFALFCLVGMDAAGGTLPREAFSILVWLMVVTKLADLFAHGCGVLFGGRLFESARMAPVQHPATTWEGFMGAMILTADAGFILAYCLRFPILHKPFFLIAVLLAIVLLAYFGNFASSLVRRSFGREDAPDAFGRWGSGIALTGSLAFTVGVAVVGGLLLLGLSNVFPAVAD